MHRDAMQYSIAGELQKMFWLILEIFCDFTGIDLFDFTESIFRDEKVHAKLQQLNPAFYENLKNTVRHKIKNVNYFTSN